MTFVVSVIGLKKCGKTTVVEHLVRSLTARGHRVGTVKSMVHSVFSIDVEGKDTFRHKDAGASFVISLSRSETAFIEKHEPGKGRRRLADVLPLVPDGTDFLVCEGLEDDDPGIAQIVCLKKAGLWEETCEVRPVGKPIAVSGIIANELSEYRGMRAYNVMNKNDLMELVELVEHLEETRNKEQEKNLRGPGNG